jgi:5-(aminomethyl)-3-furanmethanol phosphate kinase
VRRTIAKVGGSLYDLPDLGERVRTWMAGVAGPVLLVPGGGAAADAVRHLDRVHGLGEKTAHWLALRVLTVNAHFLGRVLEAPVLPSPGEATIGVLDPHAFCLADEGRPGSLPHTWAATTDAIAARVAEVAGANLVLLKSTDLPAAMSWSEAAAAGLVDQTFDAIVRRARLRVTWINLRSFNSPRR